MLNPAGGIEESSDPRSKAAADVAGRAVKGSFA